MDSLNRHQNKTSTPTDDEYDYYEKEYVIKGRHHGCKFRLGDNVRVKVARINAFRSEIDFEPPRQVRYRLGFKTS